MNNELVTGEMMADKLTTQWYTVGEAVQKATFEAVKFGAMLAEVEANLTREIGSYGQPAKGTGLQAWIEANCPDINYKTAMRFKGYAVGVRGLIGHDGESVVEAVGSSEAAALLESCSKRQLEGMIKAAMPKTVTQPVGNRAPVAREMPSLEDVAQRKLDVIGDLLRSLRTFIDGGEGEYLSVVQKSDLRKQFTDVLSRL